MNHTYHLFWILFLIYQEVLLFPWPHPVFHHQQNQTHLVSLFHQPHFESDLELGVNFRVPHRDDEGATL